LSGIFVAAAKIVAIRCNTAAISSYERATGRVARETKPALMEKRSMNAFRTIRVQALVGMFALVLIGLGAATAEAGDCHRGGGYSSSYCNYSPSYCKTNYCSYPSYNYCYYGSYCNYDYSCSYPKTCSYPMTVFDCYGRPCTVWQTGYGSAPVAILP
jgi:hypothetical protein